MIGAPIDEVHKAAILAARTLIEKEPAYTRATARLLLHTIRKEVIGQEVSQAAMAEHYAEYFPKFIARGVAAEPVDPALKQFDLARLGAALKPERDLQFDYLGLQTLYDRYFLHVSEQRIELPQAFFMRVAMGLGCRRSTAKPGPSSSTTCCRASTSCRAHPRCSIPAPALPTVQLRT